MSDVSDPSLLPPVWLLDIDGVINATASKGDPTVWPRDTWRAEKLEAGGMRLPILVAQPVLDFITEVHERGLAEIRWHTTWQELAPTVFAPTFDLPVFPVQASPEYGDGWSESHPGAWWKLPAAGRVVNVEGRRLVWTDDELTLFGSVPHIHGISEHALLVAPRQLLGLTGKNLKAIRGFLGMGEEQAA